MSTLHFLLSGSDQANIKPDSVEVVDLPADARVAVGEPAPQSLSVSFRIQDPTRVPQLRPFYAGSLTFIADGDPTAFSSTSEVVEANYEGWSTIGSVMLTFNAEGADGVIADTAIEVVPNVMWFSKVRITREFLFQTLADDIERLPISADWRIETDDPDWHAHAIALFLKGSYNPVLASGTEPLGAGDDIAKFQMPELIVETDGAVTLQVTAARSAQPQDGKDDFGLLAPDVPVTSPAHPRHGRIPASHVYRSLSALFPSTYGGELFEALVGEASPASLYRPVYFTRTFKLIPNTSLYFPAINARIQVAKPDDTSVDMHDGALPAHGVVFLRDDPADLLSDPNSLSVTLETIENPVFSGGVRWLAGTTPKPWQERGQMSELTIPLSPGSSGEEVRHVIVRLPNAHVVALDPPFRSKGICSYISMRRAVRGLIDNRITGGRLLHDDYPTTLVTCDLLDEALSSIVEDPEFLPHEFLRDRLPSIAAPDAGNMFTGKPSILRKVLTELFPQPTGLTVDLPPTPKWAGNITSHGVALMPAPKTRGEAAFWIWQSELAYFEHDVYGPYFTQHHGDDIGRGGAGAIVALGLGTYVMNPDLLGYDPTADNSERIRRMAGETGTLMMTGSDGSGGGLRRAAPLQFWDTWEFFDALKRGDTPSALTTGHSPFFWEHQAGPPPRILIVDQFSDAAHPQTLKVHEDPGYGVRVHWEGHEPEVWIGANWDD